MYQPQPQPRQIQALSQFTVTKVACGQNHSLALTKEGQAFTWGKACMLVQPGAKPNTCGCGVICLLHVTHCAAVPWYKAGRVILILLLEDSYLHA